MHEDAIRIEDAEVQFTTDRDAGQYRPTYILPNGWVRIEYNYNVEYLPPEKVAGVYTHDDADPISANDRVSEGEK